MRRAVRATRTAISPRLAIRTEENMRAKPLPAFPPQWYRFADQNATESTIYVRPFGDDGAAPAVTAWPERPAQSDAAPARRAWAPGAWPPAGAGAAASARTWLR